MISYEYNQLLNNLSWEKVGQTVVDIAIQLPQAGIAILYFSQLQSDTKQYFFCQKPHSQVLTPSQDSLKLTIPSHAELSINNNLLIQNYEPDSSCQSIKHQTCLKANISSSLSVLLFDQPHLHAILTVHRFQGSAPWQKNETHAIQMIGTQANLVISQMLVSEELRKLAQRETTINRIIATIRSSLEPPVMFAAIVKELGSALNVDGCTLSLWKQGDLFVKCVGLYNPHEPQKIIQDYSEISSSVPISQNPILQALLYTKKTVKSSDLEKQKSIARYELPWHAKARALLIVPLIVEEEIIGSITLRQSDSSREWSRSDIELAEAVTSPAAIAISQVLIHQQVKELAHRETTVNRITTTIRSSLEPPVMFAAIAKELGEALKVDGCTLSLWTEEDRYVKCVGLFNPLEPQKIIQDYSQVTSSVPIQENPILQALLFSKQTVISSDLEKQKSIARYELPWHAKARALMIVPLMVEEEIIGSITLRQSGTSRVWKKPEIELAEAVATHAAIAVQQAKLYQTTKTQAELLQAKEQKVRELNLYLTESVLKRFLPPEIVNKAATGQLSLDLTPEPRRITVLFCDLVGFTNLSSHLDALLLAEILNEYLEAMSKAVFDHDGTVDKFMGDGLMAMFGAPEDLSCPEQAKRAIATAKTMFFYLDKLNERWQKRIFKTNIKVPVLRMRCGMHQGAAVVGMFGGGQRKDYTAVGKVVNIAARLESVAQPNTVLISESVANSLRQNNKWGEPHIFQLKGIDKEFRAFSLKVSQ